MSESLPCDAHRRKEFELRQRFRRSSTSGQPLLISEELSFAERCAVTPDAH